MTAVAFDGVALEIRGRRILSAIDFSIQDGEFVGLLGPNGSGKTTLMRAILGLIRPAAGSVRVLGAPAQRGNPLLGYLPQLHRPDQGYRLTGR